MNKIDDGGPAFPTDSYHSQRQDKGMSLRDWYAGQAPQVPELMRAAAEEQTFAAAQKRNVPAEFEGIYAHLLARWNYRYADAMLAARKAEKPDA